MRDILNLFDSISITEAQMLAGAFKPGKNSNVINPKNGKKYTRAELFLIKVKTGSPFTLVDGTEVIIDPKEARAVAAWLATGPKGTVTMRTMHGGTIKNTEIQKTVELGSTESENIPIKPSDVFATDEKQKIEDFGNNIEDVLKSGGFPASEMYSKIANNPKLKSLGKLGDAVINMAGQANEGQIPVFPATLDAAQTKAIELYASEYIGALALITGAAPFIRGSREQFEEFIGGSIADMIMFFPRASNNPLADSFSVVNNATGHAVKISSKAAGKGAPPSLGSMKFPDEIRNKYPKATEFLDAAQDPGVTSYKQPFVLMNYLYEIAPNKIPKSYRSLMPFTPELQAQIENSMKTGKSLPRKIMGQFEKQLNPKVRDGSATDGGKAWWATIQDMMRLVNNDQIIPDFRAALIESLGYNFVQLYTNVTGDKLVTKAFWPAKISGQVKLRTKGSAGEQKGKMSVEISPGGDDLESPDGKSREEAGTLDTTTQEPDTGVLTPDQLDDKSQQRSNLKAADTVTVKKSTRAADEKKFGRPKQR